MRTAIIHRTDQMAQWYGRDAHRIDFDDVSEDTVIVLYCRMIAAESYRVGDYEIEVDGHVVYHSEGRRP